MSKISYNALKIDGLKTVLEQVGTSCISLGIDYFIVGAIARNIWYVANGENAKGTKDIDFAIYVSDVNKYNALGNHLITTFDYTPSKDNAFCLISPEHKQIDLLPFGEIEREGMVMIEGKGLTSISLDGFKESYDLGLVNVQIGEDNYKVCSIPAIVILKLIAFDDRPERRIKDVKDINTICQYYPTIETELIWGKYFDLYEENLTHEEVAMIVLGKEIKKIINNNFILKNRIITILDKAINRQSHFLVHMIENAILETITMKKNTLQFLKQGII